MASKTKIKSRTERKTNSELVVTIREAMKHSAWHNVAMTLSGPKRNWKSMNLSEIDAKMNDGDTIVVVGKILGVGDISKKGKICAVGFSSSAKDKIHRAKGQTLKIIDEIKSNPSAKGVVVI